MRKAPKGHIAIASPIDRQEIEDMYPVQHESAIGLRELIMGRAKEGYALFGFPEFNDNFWTQWMIKYVPQPEPKPRPKTYNKAPKRQYKPTGQNSTYGDNFDKNKNKLRGL